MAFQRSLALSRPLSLSRLSAYLPLFFSPSLFLPDCSNPCFFCLLLFLSLLDRAYRLNVSSFAIVRNSGLMHATRSALSPAKTAKAYALDLEFVKCNHGVYARSAAFVPFRRAAEAQSLHSQNRRSDRETRLEGGDGAASSHSPPRLTELLAKPIVIELRPNVTMQLAEPLPCGHLLREMIDARFAPTPALTAVMSRFQAEAEDELGSYLGFCKSLRLLRRKERNARAVESVADDAPDSPEKDEIDDMAGTTDNDKEAPTPRSSSFSAQQPMPKELTSSMEAMVTRTLQMRVGLVRNFRGLDPYGVPNVHHFDKDALELLYAAPVESRDFKRASQHISPLRSIGRGKKGYKGLAFCTHTYPSFIQGVLQTVFESPASWYAWLVACSAQVEADLQRVRDSRCTVAHGQMSDAAAADSQRLSSSRNSNAQVLTLPPGQAVDYRECSSLEELATTVSVVWAALLREGSVPVEAGDGGGGGVAAAAPPKVFVYGSADLSVIRRTLALAPPPVPPLRLNFSERAYKVSRFLTRRPDAQPSAAAAVAPQGSASSSADSGCSNSFSSSSASASCEDGPSLPQRSSVHLMSPYEARVVDLSKHPLFTATGFASSPKKTPSLSAALEKAAARDATAATLHALQHQHDPLWDAQALACLCSTAGVVR